MKAYRDEHLITIESDKEYYPITSFDQLCLPEKFKHGFKDFSKPTPIQSQCWPIAFDGRDIVGIAETGSGKTLAFSIPMLYHIQNKTKEKNPVALILSPTRELATQTAQVCKEISSLTDLRVCKILLKILNALTFNIIRLNAFMVVSIKENNLKLVKEGLILLFVHQVD